jgi:peptide methionine sulfoxide reductase msrA/msrB
MKRKMTVLGIAVGLALILVVAACSTNVKENSMSETATSGDTMKDDTMKDDTMKDDTMKDDTMKNDAMKDDTMKDTSREVETMINEGQEAVQFTLMDTNGNSVSLSDYKGEKVYVKFWASWCSICLAGLDEIDGLAGEMNDFKVLTIVTPNYKGEKSSEDFKQWFGSLETKNMTVLLDVDGMYAKEFGVRAYPTSAYIGSDGILVQVLPGHADSASIKEAFEGIY